MSHEIIPFSDIERMAVAIAKSNLFGVKTPEQACALMLIAQAEGLHPAVAARDYHVIQGRPALKADAMLARYQAAGGRVEWLEYTDARVSARFTHPVGGTVEVTWTIEQAKLANLANRDVWKQYPRAMLRARVVSEGVRTTFPGVAVGIYTPEETECFEPRDITPHSERVIYETVNVGKPTHFEGGNHREDRYPNGAGNQASVQAPPPPAAANAPATAEQVAEVAALSAEAGISEERLSAWIKAVTRNRASTAVELTDIEVRACIDKLKKKMSKPTERVIEGTIIPDGYQIEPSTIEPSSPL